MCISFIVPNWNQAICPSAGFKNCGLFYNVDYYLAIKQNEPLTHMKTWMNFKNIMLSEKSQKQNIV